MRLSGHAQRSGVSPSERPGQKSLPNWPPKTPMKSIGRLPQLTCPPIGRLWPGKENNMATTKPRRAALYLRESTDRQTVKNQRRSLENVARHPRLGDRGDVQRQGGQRHEGPQGPTGVRPDAWGCAARPARCRNGVRPGPHRTLPCRPTAHDPAPRGVPGGPIHRRADARHHHASGEAALAPWHG